MGHCDTVLYARRSLTVVLREFIRGAQSPTRGSVLCATPYGENHVLNGPGRTVTEVITHAWRVWVFVY